MLLVKALNFFMPQLSYLLNGKNKDNLSDITTLEIESVNTIMVYIMSDLVGIQDILLLLLLLL